MLPVVDLRDLDADLLRKATHEIGFFYLVGQGVGAHKDAGVATLFLVSPESRAAGGTPGGCWIDAPPSLER